MTMQVGEVEAGLSLHAVDDLGQRRIQEASAAISAVVGDEFPPTVFGLAVGNLQSRGVSAQQLIDFIRAFYALTLKTTERPAVE